MVNLRHTDDGRIEFSATRRREFNIIRNALKWIHPDKERIRTYIGNGGFWDGWCRFSTKTHFPVGFLKICIAHLKLNKVEYEIEYPQTFVSELDFSDSVKNRDYQVRAIKSLFRYKHGIIKVPTRGGKTFIAAECIRHITHNTNKKVLFFTDTVDLFNQSIGDISKHLNKPKTSIGKIREREYKIKQVTVCTIQTIQSILSAEKRLKKKQNEQIKDFNIRKNIAKSRKKELLKYLKSVDFLIGRN
jgi:predicted helicase